MNRFKAALFTLIDRKTSEFWMFWLTIALSGVSHLFPPFFALADGWSRSITGIGFDVVLGGWASIYVVPRMISKGAKAAPPAPK